MKLLLNLEEVKAIVLRALIADGIQVVADSVKVESHYEGRYDDTENIFDGISFETKNYV